MERRRGKGRQEVPGPEKSRNKAGSARHVEEGPRAVAAQLLPGVPPCHSLLWRCVQERKMASGLLSAHCFVESWVMGRGFHFWKS